MIPSSTPQILLLAHDQSLADIQRLNLETLGCQLWQATSFQQARRLLASKPLALLIMTRQLPDGDMLGRCQMLRQEYPNLPLLLLGESDNEADVVLALEAGTDDYLLQSCGTLEIRAGSGPGSDGANTSSCRVSNSNSTASASIVLPARSRPLAGHCS